MRDTRSQHHRRWTLRNHHLVCSDPVRGWSGKWEIESEKEGDTVEDGDGITSASICWVFVEELELAIWSDIRNASHPPGVAKNRQSYAVVRYGEVKLSARGGGGGGRDGYCTVLVSAQGARRDETRHCHIPIISSRFHLRPRVRAGIYPLAMNRWVLDSRANYVNSLMTKPGDHPTSSCS